MITRSRPSRALMAGAVLVLTAACGNVFSDAQVGAGERLVSNNLYAVVVPEAAEQNDAGNSLSLTWSAAGGRITATVEQIDVTVLRNAGDVTTIPTTVAGVATERLDADLRRLTEGETGDRIRYRVAVTGLAAPSAARPTAIELQLMTPAPPSDADVQTFRDAAQRFLDRVQVRK